MVSVIIPAYNEAAAIKGTLESLSAVLSGEEYEIIVVDDGSNDGMSAIVGQLSGEQTICITHRKNKGYGAAIATGCRHARGDVIAWYDADGQHRPEDLVAVVNKLYDDDLDYCIGVRSKTSFEDKNRRFGKRILKKIVNIFAKEPMEDFNSGLRAFKKEVIMKYLRFFPARFGASTVSSFIMQEANYVGGGY